MLIFIRILLIVYLIAINVYAFLLVYTQKSAAENGDKCAVRDGKLFVAGLLGGATAIYVAMFVYKHRLTNLFLMVAMPVLIAVNVYIVITCFAQNFGVIVETPDTLSIGLEFFNYF